MAKAESNPFASMAAKYAGPDLRRDVGRWAQERLGVDLWSLQREIGNDTNKRVYVRSCHDSGKCAAADDWLYLSDGSRIRHGDAVGRTDLTVLAWEAKTGKQIPALAYASDNGVKPVWRITTDRGREIRRTAEHPLWRGSRDRKRHSVNALGWQGAAEIEPGDLLLVPGALPGLGAVTMPDDQISLLGYLVADGSLGGGPVVMTKAQGPVRQHFQEIVARMGCRITFTDKNDQGMIPRPLTRGGSNPLRELVMGWGLLGHKSATKFLPEWVWLLPDEQLALLARSLFDCDGWLREDGVEYSTISKRLIRDVEYLMLRLGISGKTSRSYKFVKAADRMYESFTWEAATNRDIEKFALAVGSLQHPDRVAAMLARAGTRLVRYERRWMFSNAPDGYHWETVASVVEEEAVPTVAISVPEHHTYLTSFVEHNTFLAAVKACHWIDTHPVGQARVISTAPTNDQVVGLLWNEINQMFERAAARGTPLPGRVTQQEWWIGSYQAGVGRKPSDYKGVNFQGYHALYPLILVDEADAITADMWTALGTLMTNDNACLFAIGNPDDPTSYFRKLQNNAESLNHKVYRIRAEDTPNFTDEPVSAYVSGVLLGRDWVKERIRLWGGADALEEYHRTDNLFVPVDHPFWSSKVMAEYPDENNLTIVRAADIQFCATSTEEPEANIFGTRALGVDFAGSEHGDETVIRERVGNRALRRWGIRSADPDVVADFVVQCAQDAGCTQIVYDAAGVGFGFGATLKRALPRVAMIPFNFGAGAHDKETFLNARAELYWMGRTLARDHKWDLSRMEASDETIAQLTSVRRMADTKKIQVEGKDEVRKRIGRSPDDADALLMAFHSGVGGGEARVTSSASVQIPTGSASVVRGGGGMLPVGSAGLTRGAL